MSSKKMRVRITSDGRTEIKVEGGQGDDCLTFTKSLEQALGKVQLREFTEDYDATEPVVINTGEKISSGYTL